MLPQWFRRTYESRDPMNRWTLLGCKRKARFGYPPGSRKARFFLNHLARVVFGELPPGGSFEAGDPALSDWSSNEADLAQNEFKLPENQQNESIFGTRFRSSGLKIGHSLSLMGNVV
jgi:hypothetical protein